MMIPREMTLTTERNTYQVKFKDEEVIIIQVKPKKVLNVYDSRVGVGEVVNDIDLLETLNCLYTEDELYKRGDEWE